MDYKISIIIPIYNGEKYLSQCLESLINQTLKDIEIICVDDCSTDKTKDIIKVFAEKDGRIKHLSTDTNSGSGIARNMGLKYAKGEYISFVDSDDYILNRNSYEKLYEYAIKYHAKIISANLKAFKTKGELYKSNYCKEINEKTPIMPKDYGIPWFFQRNLFRNDFLKKNNIKFPDYSRGQDPVFLVDALTKVDIIYGLPLDFYAYRSSQNKINTAQKEIDYIKHFKDVLDVLEIYGFNEMYLEYEKIMYEVFIEHKSYYSIETLERNLENIFGKNILSTYHIKRSLKVSIIVPVYNVEKYLSQCLESLINQTLKDIEIICVNDGSTDNSLKILEEYAKKDKRIKIINKKNAGLGAARNTGMKYANGDYIGFVDSDDWVDRNMFKKLYIKAKSHNIDIVMCPVCIYDDNDQKGNYDYSYFNLDCFNEDFNNLIFDYQKTKDFFFRICVTAYNKIYRTEFLKNIGVKFPEGIIFEDNPFFYKTFLRAKKVAIIRDFLYFYRGQRADSIISNADFKYFDIIKSHKLTKKIILSDPHYDDLKIDLFNYVIRSIFNRYFQVSEKYKNDFFEIIKKDFENMALKYDEIDALNTFSKNKFNNVMNSDSYKEFELLEKNYDLEQQYLQILNLNIQLERENNKLKNQLSLKQKEIEKFLTTIGYFKYKSRNISIRIKKKVSCLYY